MRDFLPADVRKRNYVINIIKEVYESYGFEPLETPAVENIETLLGKYGDEGNQLVFKILKRGEKLDLENATKESDLSDLALRYDLTVPLARVVANNKNELPKFFKRYQIQPVWRADRPARGRFREFYQCDVDSIGSESMLVEAELISAVSEILTRLGFTNFTVRLNNRKYLTGLLEYVGVSTALRKEVLVSIDKLDKIGFDGLQNECLDKGVTEHVCDKLLYFLKFASNYDPMMEGAISVKLADPHGSDLEKEELRNRKNKAKNIPWLESREYLKNSKIGLEGIDEVEELLEYAKSLGAFPFIRFDPSLARGLSYYTGTIMEIELTDGDFRGSLGGGGRYDGLIGMFGKEQIPACGFSLGLERILVVMEERGMFPPEIAKSTAADVMVTIWNEETITNSLKLANTLRSHGLRVTVYPEADKLSRLGKQFRYADSINVPYVCVLGDDEIKADMVKLKNMTSGEEWTLKAGEVAAKIKNDTSN